MLLQLTNACLIHCKCVVKMKERCFNYKFVLEMIPISFIGMLLFQSLSEKVLNWFTLLSFVVFVGGTMMNGYGIPMYYVIKEDEIITICLFKKYHFPRREIKSIYLCSDKDSTGPAGLGSLLKRLFYGKDYVIYTEEEFGKFHYASCISKTRRTKRLIEKYYSSKLEK